MDLLSQHEAFLRAIFDAPDDDTPRLVYADFLQEYGEEDRAEFIRWQCGRGKEPVWRPKLHEYHFRGFRLPEKTVALGLNLLSDKDTLRRHAIANYHECFGAEVVKLGARITSAAPFDVLFGSIALTRIRGLDLAGEVSEGDDYDGRFFLLRTVQVITTPGVESLARHRGVRRITSLDLRNNDLDNDAARALVKSPYLDNLKRLRLLEGNRLRGKVWQQVLARFGEDVVG